jgi:LDH2 family malate/lactate/ureidoglycolate dehydrogenase
VETLTGALAGNVWSNHVARPWNQAEPPGTGHFFMAWRIDAFREMDAFLADMDAMLAELRSTPTADDAPGSVMAPGDPEAIAERENRECGILIAPGLLLELRELAATLGIDHPFE